MKVINLIGGPCCGKSTTAAGLFSYIKLHCNNSVELVTEVVKDYGYDRNQSAMEDQVLMTAEQNHKIRRLIPQGIEFAVTDASLLNGIVYGQHYAIDDGDVVQDMVHGLFHKYDNVVFLLPRKPHYDAYGRSQSEEEAMVIDDRMVEALDFNGIEYYDMRAHKHTELPVAIAEILVNNHGLVLKDTESFGNIAFGKPIC